jgi:hypothetical protein
MSEVTTELVAYKSQSGYIDTFIKESYIKYLQEFDEEYGFEEYEKTEEEGKEPNETFLISLKKYRENFDLETYIESIADDEYYIKHEKDWITVVFYKTISTVYEGSNRNIDFETLSKYNKEGYSFLLSMYYNGGGDILDEILKQL